MGTTPKKWPTNALRSLEDTLALLHDMDKLAREAQVHAVAGEFPQVVILGGDIRGKVLRAIHLLTQAKSGNY